MKKLLVYLAIILVANISFLFSPPRDLKGPNALCPQQFIRLNKYMGIPINCDSYAFIGAGIKPSYLFQKNFIRQSRPLYILAGTAVGYTIYYLSTPFHSFLESKLQHKFSGQYSEGEMNKSVLYFCFFIGYIILNVIILLLSFYLFEKIIGEVSDKYKNGKWFIWLLFFLLISNQVTKDYFWAPHQQMFNILSPLLCLYLGIGVVKHPASFKKLVGISLGSGLLVLLYGNFLLLLPTIIACSFFIAKPQLTKKEVIIKAVAISVAFFIPLLCWIAILRLNAVNFYSYETANYRQFVWVIDSLKEGVSVFLKQLGNNSLSFLKTLGPIILTGFLLLLFRVFNIKALPPLTLKYKVPQTFLTVFIFFILFFLLLGFYSDRLTFALSPLLICWFAISANQQKLSVLTKGVIASLVIGWHLYLIFFNAPHFSEEHFFL